MSIVKIVYPKGHRYRSYWLYGDDKRLKLKSWKNFLSCNKFRVESNYTRYKLVEHNPALSRAWYFLLIIEVIVSIFGGGSSVGDYSAGRDCIMTLEFEFSILDDTKYVEIYIGDDRSILTINNVSQYKVFSQKDIYTPLIEKRKRRYRLILILFFVLFFSLLVVGIIFSNIPKNT